jgi:hypothetical protein
MQELFEADCVAGSVLGESASCGAAVRRRAPSSGVQGQTRVLVLKGLRGQLLPLARARGLKAEASCWIPLEHVMRRVRERLTTLRAAGGALKGRLKGRVLTGVR